AKTATVTVYTDSPDTLSVTLDRIDRYFYGKLPLVVYGEDFDKGLWIGDSSQILVEYKDLSTGVAKYDSSSVNVSLDTLFTKPRTSISVGKSAYYDLDDRAVITLRDRRLTDGSSVTVHVCKGVIGGNSGSDVRCTSDIVDIPMYPVEGGDRTERIGFLGFSLDEASGDGVIHVEDGIQFVVFYGGVIREDSNSVSYYKYTVESKRDSVCSHSESKWFMSEFFGLTCSKDAKLINGIKYPDKQYVCDDDRFRQPDEKEVYLRRGCTSYNRNEILNVNEFYQHICSNDGWTSKRNEEKFDQIEIGGTLYFTVEIGSQIWLADDGVCPNGSHIPDADEWKTCFSYAGNSIDSLMNKYGFSEYFKDRYYRTVDGKFIKSVCENYGTSCTTTDYYVAFSGNQMTTETHSYSTGAAFPGGNRISIVQKCIMDTN
ncbi:hypothetical protein IKQ19_19400, partial [Candidatus Saccharibacteria bacterium]|nr:hypothetical protein [Candidatus Saccharibacteria bacterium]